MRTLLLLLLLSLNWPLGAVEQVAVEALFTGKAMVRIDGARRLLKLGKPSPEGVLLISANSREAVLEVDGKRQTYPLGRHVTTNFSAPEKVSAKIWRNQFGAYTTVGSVNGRNVDFLVDTGASAVALPAEDARRLGISYKIEGERINVSTANGMTSAYEVTLDRVQVGEITLTGVRGFVIEAAGPGRALLGMSFLNRVKMEDQGSVLLLHKEF